MKPTASESFKRSQNCIFNTGVIMKILLQVPEGLKAKALHLAEKLEKEGNEVLISCEPCYGACDLRDTEAERLGCEKIIHYGHNKLVESKVPAQYEEYRTRTDVIPVLRKEFNKLENYKSIGLLTTVQFIDNLSIIKEFLESNGKKAEIGKSKRLYDGQILGCDVAAAQAVERKVDCFLFMGSGKFHPIGLATKKPIFALDVEKQKIDKINAEKFMKQSLVAKELAKDAHVFGILVSTKPGQMNLKLAERIKDKIEKSGRKAHLLVLDEIKPEKLEGLQLDALINTACARIADDRALFKKPLLNPDEAEEIFK